MNRLTAFTACLLFSSNISFAQANSAEANALLDAAQISFSQYLKQAKGEAGIKEIMADFNSLEVDSLQAVFNSHKAEGEQENVLSINAIRYFLQTLQGSLVQNQFELYDVPDALQKFPLIADGLLHKTGYRNYILDMGPRRTQLMADAFRQYPEGKRMQYAADARRVGQDTYNILPFLERQPDDFPFRDTALTYVAARSPMYIVDYTRSKDNQLSKYIRASENPVIRELVNLSGNLNATELAPFAAEIAAGRHTAEEIQRLRSSDVKGYYQLLVNSIQLNHSNKLAGGSYGMQPALRDALKEKAVAFYVSQVNGLHEAKDQLRFASIQQLRVIDLYYLIISGEEELYTSSFLGIYKRMMQQVPSGHSDSLLNLVQQDQFRKFFRVCSHYNVLTDFLNQMPKAERSLLLSRFISNIEASKGNGLEDAMDVADAFSGLSLDPAYNNTIEKLLMQNMERCERVKNFFGIRLYSILLEVYHISQNKGKQKEVFSKLGNYETLSIDSVRNGDGIVHQLVVFYGDEDGKASYQSFLSLFRDAAAWKTETNAQWITLSSLKGSQPVRIYANLPLDHGNDLDEQAQKALLNYLKQQQIEPGIIIHRGHSYHLPSTLEYLRPSMKLAILGSCGGYRNILTVAQKSPSAHIVATKQVGSKLINDPMIQLINEHILATKNINWPVLWKQMDENFSKSAFTRELFAEYVPPYRNLSLFVIRLFNFDETSF